MRANFSTPAYPRHGRAHAAVFSGPAKCGRRTKALAGRLNRGDVAVIDHRDLDGVGAQMLIEREVAGVVNLSPSISGRYPNPGPAALLQAGIPLFDARDPRLMDIIREGERLDVCGNQLIQSGRVLAEGELLTGESIAAKLQESRKNLDAELQTFAKNTFEHASQEITELLAPVEAPKVRTRIRDRHTLVVVRGEGYKKDLQIIRGYLTGEKPVMIAVDGGADALLEMGLKPDIIVGDMDSVSDRALRCGAEIVVHVYRDGRESPGLARVREMGLECQTFAVPGTSEDAAMLLAFEHGAELIVAVGTHSNLYDFLEKNRSGMASTMLVRMRIGSRLVDARGVSKLYTPGQPARQTAIIVIGGLLLVAVLLEKSEPLRGWLEMVFNQLRLKLLEWRILGRP